MNLVAALDSRAAGSDDKFRQTYDNANQLTVNVKHYL